MYIHISKLLLCLIFHLGLLCLFLLCHPFHYIFCIQNWRGMESTHFHWMEAILLSLCCNRIQLPAILIWSECLLILSLLITQCSSSYGLLRRSNGNNSMRATWFKRRFHLVFCKVFSARFSFIVSGQQGSQLFSSATAAMGIEIVLKLFSSWADSLLFLGENILSQLHPVIADTFAYFSAKNFSSY